MREKRYWHMEETHSPHTLSSPLAEKRSTGSTFPALVVAKVYFICLLSLRLAVPVDIINLYNLCYGNIFGALSRTE